MPINRKLEYTVLDMIESATRNSRAAPLNLGGFGGGGGGLGGPPGGFVGRLPQFQVTYDETEAATLDTLPSGNTGVSGWSLVDNLNHIRYRLGILESGGSSVFSGIIVIDDNNSLTYIDIDTLHFIGSGVIVTDLGNGEVQVRIDATGTGSGSGASTFLDLTDTPSSYVGQQGKFVVVNSGENGVEFTTVVPGSGIDIATGDARYLKLDASNDPLTGTLSIINAVSSGAGLYVETTNNAFTADFEQFAYDNQNVSAPVLFLYRTAFDGLDSQFTGPLLYGQQSEWSEPITGDWLYFETNVTENFRVDRQGNAYSMGILLITEAPIDGNRYERQDGTWVIASGGAVISGVEEAPFTGDTYGRNNGAWVIVSGGAGGVEEAPTDGQIYGRQYESWVSISGADSGQDYVNRVRNTNYTIPSGCSLVVAEYFDLQENDLFLEGDAILYIL